MVETRRARAAKSTYSLLNASQREALESYKYVGGDTSLIYKYILSPLAQGCVDSFCPSWLAPNVITLGGLLFSVLAVVISLLVNPENQPDGGPRWLHLFCAVCMFSYLNLDNMDGKQARKIGASSPLGLLFDHGCDSINTGILLMPLAGVVGAGWSMSMICVISTTFAAFYIQTWEEYHVGELILPVVNGPTEGFLSLIAMCVISYFYGSGYWQTPSIKIAEDSPLHSLGFSFMCQGCTTSSHDPRASSGGLHTPWEMAMFGLMLSGVVTSVGTIGKVMAKKWRDSSSAFEAFRRIGEGLFGLLPFIWMMTLTYVWCSWSGEAMSPSCRVYTILLLSSMFTEITTHLMVSHISSGDIKIMERTSVLTLPPLLLANLFYGKVNMVLEKGLLAPSFARAQEQAQLRALLEPALAENSLIPAMTLFSILFTSLRVGITLREVARALDIPIFTVPKRKSI